MAKSVIQWDDIPPAKQDKLCRLSDLGDVGDFEEPSRNQRRGNWTIRALGAPDNVCPPETYYNTPRNAARYAYSLTHPVSYICTQARLSGVVWYREPTLALRILAMQRVYHHDGRLLTGEPIPNNFAG